MSGPTEDDLNRVAREVDRLSAKTTRALLGEDYHLAIVMALQLVAARHALHDGAAEDDYVESARAAWRRTVRIHRARLAPPKEE